MTVRQFMLKKFPINKWMDCPIPKHHWETIQEYADDYHEWKVKNISSEEKAITFNPPVIKTLTPHRCPVCGGNGTVPNGYYNQTGGQWSTSSTVPDVCRGCSGTGIVWGSNTW